VKGECERWAAEGINVKYETRKDRAGYKAGNLKEGMRHAYVRGCEFVAMFDADFQPAPDFLVKTVPFLVHNPSLALVQTRWKFGESLSRARSLAADNDCHCFLFNRLASEQKKQVACAATGQLQRNRAQTDAAAGRARSWLPAGRCLCGSAGLPCRVRAQGW